MFLIGSKQGKTKYIFQGDNYTDANIANNILNWKNEVKREYLPSHNILGAAYRPNFSNFFTRTFSKSAKKLKEWYCEHLHAFT